MADFFEVDFLPVGDTTSGHAVCIRYEKEGQTLIHVVDGGYEEDAQKVLDHLSKYYLSAAIDHVVATHPDGDHTVGLRQVIENAKVGALWMNRPWVHAEELLPFFKRYTNSENLARALREVFPNLARLEEIANERDIPIYDAFQGAQIGAFTVLAPSKGSFLQYVVDDEKTPEAAQDVRGGRLIGGVMRIVAEGIRMIQAAWGAEVFPADDTSPRNNMSIVQFADFFGEKVVLTADVGRAGLTEAAVYAPTCGLNLPANELRLIQVPHHGSRHNVSTETLDLWLGKIGREDQVPRSTAIVSAGKDDQDHPRKAVVRALMHRGANVIETKGKQIRSSGRAAPVRDGWISTMPLTYPSGYEE